MLPSGEELETSLPIEAFSIGGLKTTIGEKKEWFLGKDVAEEALIQDGRYSEHLHVTVARHNGDIG